MIWRFKDLPKSEQEAVGAKARTLAQLIQAGYPVPPGFVISPEAFEDGELGASVWEKVVEEIAFLRRDKSQLPVAVRSSATAEDSAAASFAGEFETILNVGPVDEILQAIHTVYQSSQSERVAAYAQAQGLESPDRVAVIVQEMVPSQLAGVLFTTDPLNGSQGHMTGNYVHGLGEQLVSGQSNAQTFTLTPPSGTYDGPAEFSPFAPGLFKLGQRLVKDLDGPQDIEWAVGERKLFILQSRPITTMEAYNPATGEWNDSRRGDYLWSNANFGEVLPGVMTPLTWSVIQIYAEETFGNPLPGDNPLMGNIGGRFYINLSLFASFMQSLGFSRERMNRESEEFFGNLPEDIAIPTIPFSRWTVLRRFAPFAIRAIVRRARNLRNLESFTAEMPKKVTLLREAINSSQSPFDLIQLWQSELEPLLRHSYQMLQAGTSKYENAYRPLRRELAAQVGEEDANLLLSGVSTEGEQLASLGPLVGLWQVTQGELSREDYLHRYGHRGPDEFELSWPRPAEDPEWLDKQLASLTEIDVPALLNKRQAEKQAAWQRYASRFPDKADKTQQKLEAAAAAARGREAIRSEITRLMGLVRQFALKAGELTGIGQDIFFLWLDELSALLEGDERALRAVPIRRAAHERLSALPPYPALISGRFDPQAWAADPNRRTDKFDAQATSNGKFEAGPDAIVQGLPGSAGVVEGTVRRLDSPKEGHLLQKGEILVAVTTNVGWTPLFPRAAAIVTDVGAPLSHAAIVARELGIPAVVGTGDATMRLYTGDRVRVNGIAGTVEHLDNF